MFCKHYYFCTETVLFNFYITGKILKLCCLVYELLGFQPFSCGHVAFQLKESAVGAILGNCESL